MPRFNAGDVVKVDGQDWVVRSCTEEGVMFCTRDHDGAQHQRVVYVGDVDDEIDQLAPTYEVSATGLQVGIPNTAGEVPTVDDAPAAPAGPSDAEVLAAAQAAEIERLKAALAAAEAQAKPVEGEGFKKWPDVKAAKKVAPKKAAADPEPEPGE